MIEEELTPEQEQGERYWQRYKEMESASQELRSHLAFLNSSEIQQQTESKSYLLSLLNDLPEKYERITNRDLDRSRFFIPESSDDPIEYGGYSEWMEKNGLPVFFPGTIIFSSIRWESLDHDYKGVREKLGQERDVSGLQIRPSAFKNSQNPLSKVGLLMTSSSNESDLLHEGLHQVDFLEKDREGINAIITEIHSFRSMMWYESVDWSHLAPILSHYIDSYEDSSLSREQKKELVLKAVKTIEKLDKVLPTAAVTQILLNSLTLDQINRWSEVPDDELESMRGENLSDILKNKKRFKLLKAEDLDFG